MQLDFKMNNYIKLSCITSYQKEGWVLIVLIQNLSNLLHFETLQTTNLKTIENISIYNQLQTPLLWIFLENAKM